MGRLVRYEQDPWRSVARRVYQFIGPAVNGSPLCGLTMRRNGDGCRLTPHHVVLCGRSCQTRPPWWPTLLWAGGCAQQFGGTWPSASQGDRRKVTTTVGRRQAGC